MVSTTLAVALLAGSLSTQTEPASEGFRIGMTPSLVVAASVMGMQDEAPTAEQAAETAVQVPQNESLYKWDNQFTLGGGLSSGNTDTANVNAGVVFKGEKVNNHKLVIDGGYFYGESDGDEDTNKGTAGIVSEWTIAESNWFWFADARYDFDEYKSWTHRINGHVGIGYHIFRTPEFDWSVRAGIGAVKEFGSDRNEIYPEAMLGTDLEWRITENIKVGGSSYIFPDLGETGEYRWINKAFASTKINQADGLSIMVGVLHEYESDPDEGVDNTDFKLFGGLVLDF